MNQADSQNDARSIRNRGLTDTGVPSVGKTATSSPELTRDGYAKLTADYIERLRQEEVPYWRMIRQVKRSGYRSVEEAAKSVCTVAWNLTALTGDEHAGMIVRRKEAAVDKPFEFLGPERGIGWLSFVNLQIPKGTTYQATYHTHSVESGPSPDDHDVATATNLPLYLCLKSGRIALYLAKQVSPDRRLYEYSKDIAIVKAPPNPPRFLSVQELERSEMQLWKTHLKWRLEQMGHWSKSSP